MVRYRQTLVSWSLRDRFGQADQALHELITTNQAFLEPLNGQQRDSIASALRQLLLHHEPR